MFRDYFCPFAEVFYVEWTEGAVEIQTEKAIEKGQFLASHNV